MVNFVMGKLALVALISIISIYTRKKMYNSFKVIEVIRLLFESMDSMNESVRLYIITGDSMYLSIYKSNADARAGEDTWTSIPDEVVGYNGPQSSLKNTGKNTDFSEEEFKHFIKILTLSEELLWIETSALNIAQGLSDPNGVAKKKFEEMKNKTYVQFPEHKDEKDTMKNKKDAIKFLKDKGQEDIHNKILEEYNVLNKIVAERLQYNFSVYKWVYFILYLSIFSVCVLTYVTIKKVPNYEIGMTSVYNNIYIFVTMFMIIYAYKVYSTEVNRIISFIVSNVMQEISSELTKAVRDYAKTGDIKYFKRYWNIVNIKNGKVPWSGLSETFKYWNVLPSVAKNENLMMTLEELLEKSNFTQKEMDIFKRASDESNSLTWKDIETFNWAKELWDKDNKGRQIFSQRGAKSYIRFMGKYDQSELKTTPLELSTDIDGNRPANPKQASVDNLYSDEYIVASNLIKYYTTEGESYVYKRINDNVERTSTILYLLCILFLVIIFVMHRRGAYEYIK